MIPVPDESMGVRTVLWSLGICDGPCFLRIGGLDSGPETCFRNSRVSGSASLQPSECACIGEKAWLGTQALSASAGRSAGRCRWWRGAGPTQLVQLSVLLFWRAPAAAATWAGGAVSRVQGRSAVSA